MEQAFKQHFIDQWNKYFTGAQLPLTFFYSTDPAGADVPHPTAPHVCMVGQLKQARNGKPIAFTGETLICGGGKRYCGFPSDLGPSFRYFLSCGIPGKLEGERYKKTPEMVDEIMRGAPKIEAPDKYLVFKRFDQLAEADQPAGIVFFGPPDVISGIFTLCTFGTTDPNSVISPFAAGCGQIVMHVMLQSREEQQKGVLGVFDVSARPSLEPNTMTLGVPLKKFKEMVSDMDESFLITPSWEKVRRRIESG